MLIDRRRLGLFSVPIAPLRALSGRGRRACMMTIQDCKLRTGLGCPIETATLPGGPACPAWHEVSSLQAQAL